jgi:hypothetical protein
MASAGNFKGRSVGNPHSPGKRPPVGATGAVQLELFQLVAWFSSGRITCSRAVQDDPAW